ncbi:MAG: transposase family protein [Acidobacteria bacterium]|nr:transposase family protein [Acidobacteriota bacterium]
MRQPADTRAHSRRPPAPNDQPRLSRAVDSSIHFLDELRRALPFPIKKLQCDNGSEFPIAFKLAVEAAGIKHRYIKPRRPQQNGKVERSHRVDGEEFWSRHEFQTVAAAESSLAGLGAAVQPRTILDGGAGPYAHGEAARRATGVVLPDNQQHAQ